MPNRILASELLLPYALVCAVDNSCSGLSTHPGGAMQEYLEHKKTIAGVTNAVVSMLATALAARAEEEEGAGAEPEPESEPEAA